MALIDAAYSTPLMLGSHHRAPKTELEQLLKKLPELVKQQCNPLLLRELVQAPDGNVLAHFGFELIHSRQFLNHPRLNDTYPQSSHLNKLEMNLVKLFHLGLYRRVFQ